MDPIPLRDIADSARDYFGKFSPEATRAEKNIIEQGTKFDRPEKASSLESVTFHDSAGRMIHESYVPKDFSDTQVIAFVARLIPNWNPLKEKLKTSSVKRK